MPASSASNRRGELKQFALVLEDHIPHLGYSPGQEVEGRIIVNACGGDLRNIKKVKIKIKGEAKVEFTRRVSSDTGARTETHKTTEQYLK